MRRPSVGGSGGRRASGTLAREDIAAAPGGAPAMATITVVVVNGAGRRPRPTPATRVRAEAGSGLGRAAMHARSVDGQGTDRTLPTRRAMGERPRRGESDVANPDSGSRHARRHTAPLRDGAERLSSVERRFLARNLPSAVPDPAPRRRSRQGRVRSGDPATYPQCDDGKAFMVDTCARGGRVREARGTVRLDRRADDAHTLGVVVARVGAGAG